MSEESKKYYGICINRCDFQGEVVEEPQYFAYGDGEGALIQLGQRISEMDANGQFVDKEQTITLTVLDTKRVANLVKKYIQVGRKIHAECYYKAWSDPNGAPRTAMVVKNIHLGSKPWEGGNKQQEGPANGIPNLPAV